uniref:Potassium channel domain-containing protein n=1 Tax=viral metagenome TaxID=1070528 RepID=A0A6C0KF74_9ZZZZ
MLLNIDGHGRFWIMFLVANFSLTIVFTLLRVGIMTDEHFVISPARRPNRLGDSIYISIMHQSTIGDSSIVPKSGTAITLSVLQAFTVFLVYGFAVYALVSADH